MTKIVTLCKECKFSIVENGIQKGCEFDRINKFKDAGLNVEQKDGFYIINRECLTFQNKDSPVSAKEIRDYIKTKVIYLLIVDKKNTIDDVFERISKIIGDGGIGIINTLKEGFDYVGVVEKLNNTGRKFFIHSCYNVKYEGHEVDNFLDYLDKSYNYQVYVDLTYNKEYKYLDFAKLLDNHINEKMNFVSCIKETKDIPMCCNISLHQMLGGNYEKTVIQKISEVSLRMIKSWEDVLND